MYSRFISLILITIFLSGFISEIEATENFEHPGRTEIGATIKSSTLQNEWGNQAPFDDCCEGAPCNGHCHFGQCLSVILVEVFQIAQTSPEIKYQAIYKLPPLVGGYACPFRPPIA